MSITFTAAILCDLVRQEISKKYIAVGIYSSAVVFPSFPAIGTFQLLARMNSSEPGSHILKVRLLIADEENQRIEGEMEVERPGEDWLILPIQPVQFQVPGPMVAQYCDEKDEWKEFFRISVGRPPIASPQPS